MRYADFVLVVEICGEFALLLARNRGVALHNLGELAAFALDTERKRTTSMRRTREVCLSRTLMNSALARPLRTASSGWTDLLRVLPSKYSVRMP